MTAGGDNRIVVAALEAGTISLLANVPDAHDGDVNSVRWHPTDSTALVTAGDDCDVKIWTYRAQA